MNVSTKIYERRGLLSIAEALALMISFGSFIATLIFGILEAVKEDNKNRYRLKRLYTREVCWRIPLFSLPL
ncbi:putative holin-like toxin [Enterococcus faecalis]|nr:putative holin-like toxin [Enterococcus faecalis]